MSETRTVTDVVRVTRTFPVSRARLFQAWTDPDQIPAWWLPEGFGDPEVEVDLRPGGAFRIAMVNAEGVRYRALGTFTEIRQEQRLVSTWSWAEWPEAGETTLTVEFRDTQSGSELVLEHTGFPTPEIAQEHEKGWVDCVERLGPATAD